jgi:trk system potassium uptake protein TrkA
MRHGLVLIIGSGQLGKTLAASLSQDGNDIVIVDTDKGALDDLGRKFRGSRVEGDGTDFAVLQAAGIAEAALVIAVTQDDAINLMVTQAAKTLFKVPRVMARLNDPQRNELFSQFGIETISPASLAADLFRKRFKEGNAAP